MCVVHAHLYACISLCVDKSLATGKHNDPSINVNPVGMWDSLEIWLVNRSQVTNHTFVYIFEYFGGLNFWSNKTSDLKMLGYRK